MKILHGSTWLGYQSFKLVPILAPIKMTLIRKTGFLTKENLQQRVWVYSQQFHSRTLSKLPIKLDCLKPLAHLTERVLGHNMKTTSNLVGGLDSLPKN